MHGRGKLTWLEDVRDELVTQEISILANIDRITPVTKRHRSGFDYLYYVGSTSGRHFVNEPLFALKYGGLYRQANIVINSQGSYVVKVVDHLGERALEGTFSDDKKATTAILEEFQKEFSATLKRDKK